MHLGGDPQEVGQDPAPAIREGDEEAALVGLVALGWLDGTGIIWTAVPVDADRAVAQVRRHQMEQGWMPPGTE